MIVVITNLIIIIIITIIILWQGDDHPLMIFKIQWSLNSDHQPMIIFHRKVIKRPFELSFTPFWKYTLPPKGRSIFLFLPNHHHYPGHHYKITFLQLCRADQRRSHHDGCGSQMIFHIFRMMVENKSIWQKKMMMTMTMMTTTTMMMKIRRWSDSWYESNSGWW